MANEKKGEKPLLFGGNFAKESAAALEASQIAAQRATEDPNWIPGYSEQIRARDILSAEYGSMTWQQREHQLRELGVREYKEPPVHVKPARIAGMDGTVNVNVRTEMNKLKAEGYRLMTEEDLKTFGFEKPPLYEVEADGTIRRGDLALMCVDAERAKQNRARKEREAAEREGSSMLPSISMEVSRDRNFTLEKPS